MLGGYRKFRSSGSNGSVSRRAGYELRQDVMTEQMPRVGPKIWCRPAKACNRAWSDGSVNFSTAKLAAACVDPVPLM